MNLITDHKERWKTATVLLFIVAIVGVLNNHFITWLFLAAVYMIAFYEAQMLLGAKDSNTFAYAVSIWIIAGFYPHASDIIFLALIVFAAKLAYFKSDDIQEFLPILYPTAGMLFTWMLYLGYGMASLVWMLVIVAFTDVGAFFVGKSIGKTSFSPTSPNKTLEGVAGGIISATVIGAIVGASILNISFFTALLISLISSIFSIFGDLFESYIKRKAKVKDSGTILPGHGGILDRIDGYLFASISLYILLKIAGN